MRKLNLYSIITLFFLGLFWFNSNIFSQSSEPPLTLEQVNVGLEAVKAKLIPAKQLESEIQKRKVGFALTNELNQKLRESGATAQILKAIKDNSPPPSVAPVAQNTPQTRNRTINSFKNQKTGMEFILIPKGTFMMGSDVAENEMPVRKITFAQDFFIGKYEVTQGEWQTIMGNAREKVLESKGVNKELNEILGENYPMVGVTWDDAKQFINKLNESNDNYIYSLPTEAEWEYACRAGTTTFYFFGNEINSTQASFTDQKFSTPPKYDTPEKQINKLKPVGLYEPNAWGIYDMHGNVWEWVEDFYFNSYTGLPTDGTANLKKGDTDRRILRGGGWSSLTRLFLRSSLRNDTPRNFANLATGFRVVARLK